MGIITRVQHSMSGPTTHHYSS